MKTTVKQINFKLSKKDLESLEYLIETLGENQSQVFRRALHVLHEKIKRSHK